mgnify:CR=1 FL=1
MKYLHHINLPSLDLSREEEAYLDFNASLDLQLNRLPRTSYGLWNAIGDFKDSLYELIIDHLANGEDKKHWEELLSKIRNDKKLNVEKARCFPIEDLMKKYGIEVKRGFARSPFMPEQRTGSLKIYPESNTWWDYASSQGSSVIDFVMKMDKCNFIDAVKKLS